GTDGAGRVAPEHALAAGPVAVHQLIEGRTESGRRSIHGRGRSVPAAVAALEAGLVVDGARGAAAEEADRYAPTIGVPERRIGGPRPLNGGRARELEDADLARRARSHRHGHVPDAGRGGEDGDGDVGGRV